MIYMNLIDKLITNYRECADIVNPFFFNVKQIRQMTPIYTLGNIMPSSFGTSNRSVSIELSANPDNININIDTMGQRKTLTVFNRDQLYTLNNIAEIKFERNFSTGCLEFKILCESYTFTIGGKNNE